MPHEDFVSIKIKRETQRKLRLLTGHTEEFMYELLERLVKAEYVKFESRSGMYQSQEREKQHDG